MVKKKMIKTTKKTKGIKMIRIIKEGWRAPHDVVHIVVARLDLGLRGNRVQPGQ